MIECSEGRRGQRAMTFGTLAQHILALDSAIERVALEEPGRKPRWAWRDSNSGNLCAGFATTQIVDCLQPSAHVTVAASRGIAPYVLGTKLTPLLDGCTQPPALQ